MTTINPKAEDLGVGWAHIFPQTHPHAFATIIGNRKALEALREAIDDALGPAKKGEARVFARDGEGYSIRVEIIQVLDNLGWPYYADRRHVE